MRPAEMNSKSNLHRMDYAPHLCGDGFHDHFPGEVTGAPTACVDEPGLTPTSVFLKILFFLNLQE